MTKVKATFPDIFCSPGIYYREHSKSKRRQGAAHFSLVGPHPDDRRVSAGSSRLRQALSQPIN
jgi:hypothetical protein